MDLREQKGLEISKQDSIRVLNDGWAVRSQNSKRYYFVDKGFTCTCPDCQTRQRTCKHAFAVKYFLRFELPDGKVEQVPITYKQAWKAYNEAQTTEVNKFDELLRELVENIEEPAYKFGRPRLSQKELLFCSIQKVYSQLSSRRAYSLFKNAEQRKQIIQAPHFNAINKFLNQEEITPILKGLVGLSSAPLKEVETKFAIDSTGFRTTRFTEYCRDKHGTTKKHAYVKLHACCGVKTNVICSAEITKENGADSPQFEPLVKATSKNGFEIKEMTADKAYSSRANLTQIDELGGTAFIPFKKGTRGKSKNTPIWKKMFHYFLFNQEEFNRHYHLRSNVETSFMALKMKFGDCLKSKTFESQTNELLCKVIAFNIVTLIHEIHELGISADFNDLGVKN